jgi:hypothetical protein
MVGIQAVFPEALRCQEQSDLCAIFRRQNTFTRSLQLERLAKDSHRSVTSSNPSGDILPIQV